MANVLESFLAGREARRQQDTADRVNALTGFMQQNGPAIFNGDQSALGQLAGMGPEGLQTAIDLRNANDTRETNAITRQRSDQEWQWKNEDRAQATKDRLTDDEHKAAVQAFDALRPYYENGDEAGFRKMVEAEGGDPAVLTMESYPSAAAKLGIDFKNPRDVALGREKDQLALDKAKVDLANAQNPEQWRDATQDEAKARGYNFGQINTKTGEFKGANGPSNGITFTDKDGNVTQIGGQPGGGKPLTEGQSKDVGFATRAEPAADAIDKYQDALLGNAGRVGQFADKVPLGMAKGLQSDDYQLASQAAHELATTMLRKDSGAVINKDEYADFYRTYIPQPGDGAPVLQQKANARRRMIEGLKAGMTPEAVMKQVSAIGAANDAAPAPGADQTKTAPPDLPAVPNGVDADLWPQLWENMSDEDKALFK